MNAAPLRSCGFVTLLLMVGCAQRLEFRTIDGTSGVAISGVRVQVEERGSFSYFYRTRHIRDAGSTATNGGIVVNGVRPKHSIVFEAAGYRPTLAALDERGRVSLSWFLSPKGRWSDPPPRGPWSPSGLVVTNIGEVIPVPLLPATGKE